jgi:hypothetical protein
MDRWWSWQGTGRVSAGVLLAWLLSVGVTDAWAQNGTEFGFPTVPLKALPEPLRVAYKDTKPEMNDRSRCAAAFDPSGDVEKMTLKCSVYIRMAAEGARRAMAYCEEKRQELRIKAPCRVVQE